MEPAKASIRPFEHGYMTGLLALEHKTLAAMSDKGLLPHGHSHSASLLASEPTPYQHGMARRLAEAPPGGVLALDLVNVRHEGNSVQGIGRVYSSSDKAVVWGHSFVSSALVFKGQAPYPLQLAPFVSEPMATQAYPRLTATEGMLTVAGDVHEAGYQVKAAVFDAQFTTRLGLRSLKVLPVPFVGRCRTDLWVGYGKERVQVRDLAERYPPGRSRYYQRFGWYAKRLAIWLEDVGRLDLIIIWKAKGTGWQCFALLSTLQAGIQDVLQTWKLRWDLEVSHRLYKQNLGLGKCQCRRYSAQLKHADLVLDAFLEVRTQRQCSPGLSWRRAQEELAIRRKSTVLTGISPLAA